MTIKGTRKDTSGWWVTVCTVYAYQFLASNSDRFEHQIFINFTNP